MDQLIVAVKAYAITHYNESAWDIPIECWEKEDYIRNIGDAKTEAQAIKNVGASLKYFAGYRDDIQATAF